MTNTLGWRGLATATWRRRAWGALWAAAALAMAGCGGRFESAADGGAAAPTWVKAYSIDGQPLQHLATSPAADGSTYVLARHGDAGREDELVLARLDPAGNVTWSRRPQGSSTGVLTTSPEDAPRRRRTAPTSDGGFWTLAGRPEQGVQGPTVWGRRLEKWSPDGEVVHSLSVPDEVQITAMAAAGNGLVAAGEVFLNDRSQLWILRVGADGQVRTARTEGPMNEPGRRVTVTGVAADTTGNWIVSGQQSQFANARRFTAGFDADDNLAFRREHGTIDGIEFDIDQGVRVGRGSGGAGPDWVVTAASRDVPAELAEHKPPPYNDMLQRIDALTGERREALRPPSDVAGVCAYTDLRARVGGLSASDVIEALGREPDGDRACIDRWTREPGSGRLLWAGRSWLAVPQPVAGWRVTGARWGGVDRVWLMRLEVAERSSALLQRIVLDAPAAPDLTFVREPPRGWGGGDTKLTVMADGEVMLSPPAEGAIPLQRLRVDGSVRWTREFRRSELLPEARATYVQALPGGGVVALLGQTWLRYSADGRLLTVRRLTDLEPLSATSRGLVTLDIDGDGRDDDALLLVSDEGSVRLRRLDADGQPLPGEDQRVRIPMAGGRYGTQIELHRIGERRLVVIPSLDTDDEEYPRVASIAALWTDAAGNAGDLWLLDLPMTLQACGSGLVAARAHAVPRLDGGLSVVASRVPSRRFDARSGLPPCDEAALQNDLVVSDWDGDGTPLGETAYRARSTAPDGTPIEFGPTLVGADRQPDGGLLLQAQWPSATSLLAPAPDLPAYPAPEGPDEGDLGLAALAPNGTVRWVRSYGGARSEWYRAGGAWRGAQQDNGLLSIGRSHSFAATGALLAVRADADGRVGAACAAARDEVQPALTALRTVPVPLVATLSRLQANVQREPAQVPAPVTGFFDTAVTWTTAQACGGVSQAPTLRVEVVGPGQVDSQPGGIACRAGLGSDCTQSFSLGTAVTLTAVPDAGAQFIGWEGDCAGAGSTVAVSITLDQPRRCVARFGPATPPPAGLCAADRPLAGSWQDATAGAAPPFIAGGSYGLGATVRGGLPLVAVAASDSTSNSHRPWVAQWTGSAWSRLGSDADPRLPGVGDAPQLAASDTEVWMAWAYTAFNPTDGLPPSRIAVWRHDGQRWSALPTPVAEASGTLQRWWLLRPADGQPVIAWLGAGQQRIHSLRWDGAAWVTQPVLESLVGGGRWALAADAAGQQVAVVQALAGSAGSVQVVAWSRPLAPGGAWTERAAGTLPWPGRAGEFFVSAAELLVDGERLDAVLLASDSSGRGPATGSFVVGRQAGAAAAWAIRGDPGTLRREPDFGVRPVDLQWLAGCGGTPWLAWRDNLNYPEARLWAIQSADGAPPTWAPLGGPVVADASIGSSMRLLAPPGSAPWAVVVRATRAGAGSSVLRPELRLQRFVPAGP